MFDHVKFGVSDYAASKAFFLAALEPLGVAIVGEGVPTYGVEMCRADDNASLCLFQTDEKPAHLHLAFVAKSRAQVDAFYRAALQAGGKDFHHIPCLNADPAWIRALAAIAARHLEGWPTREAVSPQDLAKSRERALAMGAER